MKSRRCQVTGQACLRDPCCLILNAVGISYQRTLGREVTWSHFLLKMAYGEGQRCKAGTIKWVLQPSR